MVKMIVIAVIIVAVAVSAIMSLADVRFGKKKHCISCRSNSESEK